jgi:hypothetical protein
MDPIARWALAGGLCLIAPVGADCSEKEAAPETSSRLVTSDLSAEMAAARGTEVVRAVAVSDPAVTARHRSHMSTRMGNISGGGTVTLASCRQKFSVSEVVTGAGRAGEREISYSFIESAAGFPLPRPTRPVAKGEKCVVVLGVDGRLIKVMLETDENRRQIEDITNSIKARPPAAQALLKAMRSFTLKIEYHGPASASYPSVWCTTNPKLPDELPSKWLVMQNLSDLWAYQAVDHLVGAGMLKPETIRAQRKRPRPQEPFYSLTLSADGVDELIYYLGWGKEAYARIEALGRAIQYDRGTIAKVLLKLK